MITNYVPLTARDACAFEVVDGSLACKNCGLRLPQSLSTNVKPFVICRNPERPSGKTMGTLEFSPGGRSNRHTGGVGTELSKLLAAIGFRHTANCPCASRAASLDNMGIDAAESQTETVVGWMREEAEKRKLPFLDAAGRLLVKRAIHNARKAEARRAREAEGSSLPAQR